MHRATCEQAQADAPQASQSQKDGLTFHNILCRGMAKYVNHYRDGEACFQVQSVLAKIELCRTSALGERWYECDACGELTKLYNSCGDRHCPACSGSKRSNWSDQVSKLLLPAVDYYQVVFTLPDILSTLTLANRRLMADLLSQSAWKALNTSIRVEQGYEPAATFSQVRDPRVAKVA